ncbi:hypothetical protein Shyhy02_73940 [Streptomyces hygroscopicus subsp. hygroscopicus]|nr:hypothetical protein Shyhy02_73940 [Streptomyces hygroscopicus subsp. hygroscopicus]
MHAEGSEADDGHGIGTSGRTLSQLVGGCWGQRAEDSASQGAGKKGFDGLLHLAAEQQVGGVGGERPGKPGSGAGAGEARRVFCDRGSCSRRTFVEQVGGLTE